MESEEQSDNVDMAVMAREVEEFVAAGGWDQGPQLFALVPTQVLLREQPELAGHVDTASSLTPVAQGPLPEGDLADVLGTIAWPEAVTGCALVQEIIVLPPGAETQLPQEEHTDVEALRQAAADHPQRTEARLVAVVDRQGRAACLMRLRGMKRSDGLGNTTSGSENTSEEIPDEIVERPDLAPNLIDALRATLV